MNVNESLVYYLRKLYNDDNNVINHAKNSALYFQIAHIFDASVNIEKQFAYFTNRLRYDYFVKNYIEIQNKLSSFNITVILFKGVALANRLYEKAPMRHVGDIDIYVMDQHFSAALTQLIRLGYDFLDEKTIANEHHIVLVRDNVTVELHRSIFNPRMGIDETYLLSNIVPFSFSNYTIQTFNVTATFLHLIYHLYVDTYWSHYSLHSILTNEKVPTTKGILYRAYELALFSEKYYDQIIWEDIFVDLKHQKLKIFFKKMIYDIVSIFPSTFPDEYLQVVNNMEYINDEHDVWCRCLLESNCSKKDVGAILSKFIDDYWIKHSSKNISIRVGDSFILDRPIAKDFEGNDNLTCMASTEKIGCDLKLTFKVTNDDLCLTAEDNFDTSASDGIHIMLFGTEKYSYNSIYVFPKIINGTAKAIPVDVKRGNREIIDTSLIIADCEFTDGDYTVTVTLTKKFLQDNSLTNYLYMGLIVVDCSSKTKKRKAELVLSDTYSEWYNPTYFAKIDVNDQSE